MKRTNRLGFQLFSLSDCRTIFVNLALRLLVLSVLAAPAARAQGICHELIQPRDSRLGINWTPYARNGGVEIPEVLADPYVLFAFKSDGFREFLLQEAKQGRAEITDYKHLVDAEPLYSLKTGPEPVFARGRRRPLRPEELTYPQLREYLLKNYRLAKNGVTNKAYFSNAEKIERHPLLAEWSRRGENFELIGAAIQKIHETWEDLLRQTPRRSRTTLLRMPRKYVVAGGRYGESYFWDSFWIMKGLIESGYHQTAKGMLENFAYLYETHGIIPNGNRFYYLTRTQLPVFVEMVALLEANGVLNFEKNAARAASLESRVLNVARDYYDKIWKGTERYRPESGLFSYSDGAGGSSDPNKIVVRPEAGLVEPRKKEKHSQRVYAELSWDFSYTRAGLDPQNWAPVDLNFTLMGYAEKLSGLLAKARRNTEAERFRREAGRVRRAIVANLYDKTTGWFVDLHMTDGKLNETVTAASFFAFYFEAYPKNANSREILKSLLARLKPEGDLGLHTTDRPGPGQWDGNWTWAPLTEIAYQSLVKYGLHEEARRFALDYCALVLVSFFKNNRTFHEKYRTDGTIALPKDTEIYGNETGFGWTNGTIAVFLRALSESGDLPALERELSRRLNGAPAR